MGEEIAFQNGRISDFQGLVTLILDRVILHTIMHHSSTSTYIPNFMKIEETSCGRTDGQDIFLAMLLGRLGWVDLTTNYRKIAALVSQYYHIKELRILLRGNILYTWAALAY